MQGSVRALRLQNELLISLYLRYRWLWSYVMCCTWPHNRAMNNLYFDCHALRMSVGAAEVRRGRLLRGIHVIRVGSISIGENIPLPVNRLVICTEVFSQHVFLFFFFFSPFVQCVRLIYFWEFHFSSFMYGFFNKYSLIFLWWGYVFSIFFSVILPLFCAFERPIFGILLPLFELFWYFRHLAPRML